MQIQIEPIGLDKSSIVQEIFERSPTYFRNVARSAVLPHFAVHEMTDGPPVEKQTPTYKKVFCLLRVDEKAIGIVDLHKDHPEKGHCYIGLLLLDESNQGKGIGKLIYLQIEKFVKTQLHCSKLVLGVSQDNNVEGFWEKVGFKRNGRTYFFKNEDHNNEVFEMEKVIL